MNLYAEALHLGWRREDLRRNDDAPDLPFAEEDEPRETRRGTAWSSQRHFATTYCPTSP